MTAPLKWQAPPEVEVGKKSKYIPWFEALVSRPGEWALLSQAYPNTGVASITRTSETYLSRNHLPGVFLFVGRRSRHDPKNHKRLIVDLYGVYEPGTK